MSFSVRGWSVNPEKASSLQRNTPTKGVIKMADPNPVTKTVVEESVETLAEHLFTKGLRGSKFVQEFLVGLPEQTKLLGLTGANLAGQVASGLSEIALDKLNLNPGVRRWLKLTLPHLFLGIGEAAGNVINLTDDEWKGKVTEAVGKAAVPEAKEPDLEKWFDDIGEVPSDYAVALAVTMGMEGADFVDEIATVPPNVFKKAVDGLGDIQADGKLADVDRDKLLAVIHSLGHGKLTLWTRIKQAFGDVGEWIKNRKPLSKAAKVALVILALLGIGYLVFLGYAIYKFADYEVFDVNYADAALWGLIWALIIIALLWPVRFFEDVVDNLVDRFRTNPVERGWSHNSIRELSGGLLIFTVMVGGYLLAAALLVEQTQPLDLSSKIKVGRIAMVLMGVLVSGASMYALAYGLHERVKKNVDLTVRTSYKMGRWVVFGLISLVVLAFVGVLIKKYLWTDIHSNVKQQFSLAEAAGGNAMIWLILLGVVVLIGLIVGAVWNRADAGIRNRFLGGAIAVVALFAVGFGTYALYQRFTAPDKVVENHDPLTPQPPIQPPPSQGGGGQAVANSGTLQLEDEVYNDLCRKLKGERQRKAAGCDN